MDISQIKAPEIKKGRGRPRLNILQKWANPSKMDALKGLYERITEREHKYKTKKIYKKKAAIIKAIAQKYRVDERSLENHINRTNKSRLTKKNSKQ